MKATDHSSDAEANLIAAAMVSPGVFTEVATIVEPEDFYSEQNQIIWQAIQDMADQGKAQDITTVTQYLRQKDLLKKVGGASYVSSLLDALPDTANAPHYAGIVRDMSTSRSLIHMCRGVANCSDPNEAIDIAQTGLDSIAAKQVGNTSAPISVIAERVRERSYGLAERRVKVEGVKSGIEGLDNLITTMAPGELFILAARPGVGKTAIAGGIALNAAMEQGKSVLFVSLEMSQDELTQRFLGQIAGINTRHFRSGNFNLTGVPNDLERLDDAVAQLQDTKLYIDDRSMITTTHLRTLARKVQATQGLDLLIVDYLQLMHGPGGNSNEIYGNISRNLKCLCKDLHVPGLVLSQMSRVIEHENRDRPRLADLRDSGRIEQDADKVAFAVRDKDNTPNIAQLQLAKHRQGPIGDVPLRFDEETSSFSQGSWEDFVDE